METIINARCKDDGGKLKCNAELHGETYQLILLTAEIVEKLSVQLDISPEIFAMRLAELFIEEKN